MTATQDFVLGVESGVIVRRRSRTDRCLLVLALLISMRSVLVAQGDPSSATSGKSLPTEPVAEFKLRDYRGAEHALHDYVDRKLVVLAFLGTECPLAKLYGSRLSDLARTFEPQGVAFLGVNANQHDSVTEIASYARRHDIPFPILKDVGNRLADQVGAERTPEVIVLDGERRIRYRGRIDDQYGVGYAREQPQQHDLKTALEELLAGKTVSRPMTAAVGCLIAKMRTPDPQAKVNYVEHIAPLLNRRCVECHRAGEIAPFALTEYNEVAGWASTIAEVVREGRMPPWHANPEHGKFANDRALTAEEKALIAEWVRAGAPQGDVAKTPPLPTFVSGWGLPKEPDLVVPMASKPYQVPATGAVRYQYFSVDPQLKEDRWVKASEVLPGNRAVVHHVLVFAKDPEDLRRGGGVDGFLASYVPGLRPPVYPDGMAKKLPAGSKLIFQVHYTPIGTPQEDICQLGLIFADEHEVTHEVVTTSAAQRNLRIEPLRADQSFSAMSRPAPTDVLLLSFMPHMHLRGQAFRYEAVLPGGQREVLLDIPRYDFNWQTGYVLAQPRLLPAGTRLACQGVFDNSPDNLNNPDPQATVRWGDQTWEEMLIGYFDIAIPRTGEEVREPAAMNRPLLNRLVENALQQYDKNGDGELTREEIPDRLQRLFDRLDADSNGRLSRAELEKLGAILPRN